LDLAPGRLQHLVDGPGQQLEVMRVVDQLGTAQQQVVKVAVKPSKNHSSSV
jgi:hypothetical protein